MAKTSGKAGIETCGYVRKNKEKVAALQHRA